MSTSTHPHGDSTHLGPRTSSFTTVLAPSLLNIEDKVRSNLFAWRGQFSPQLVEALLTAYTPKAATVLDPFMGSGTVLVESARRGHEVHGVEVNPAALSIARVYEFCSLSGRDRRALLQAVDALIDPTQCSDLPLFSSKVGQDSVDFPRLAVAQSDPALKALLRAVVILADVGTEALPQEHFRRRWSALRQCVLSLPESAKIVRAYHGDARALPLPGNTVDFVLTSPPYINVFNYHHHYRGSVEALGWHPLVVARSEIGANRKFRQNRFLTVVQYCIDLAIAFAELDRVGTSAFRAIFVVGRESAVHKTPFFNGQIVGNIAARMGFRVSVQQERVFTNRFGQLIYEDILNLERSGSSRTHDAVMCGRQIGTDELANARQRVPPDRAAFLDQALSLAESIEPSPILVPSATNKHSGI